MKEKLTKELAILLFRELRNWIAEDPTNFKADWPRWQSNGGDVPMMQDDCPLCEYLKYDNGSCSECCIIDWGTATCGSKVALQIANLPEREEKETKND